MNFKTKRSEICHIQGIHHNADFSEIRSFHHRAECMEDLHFYFEDYARFSLFVVGALTDFSKTATRRANDDLFSAFVRIARYPASN
jgi:hypothetical protein